MGAFKEAGHLFRFAGLFVLAFLVFWLIRGYVVPKSFGQYGHYRAAAIGEIGARPVRFAGHGQCEQCHVDVADKKSHGKHAHVNCEACHGAQAIHASSDDPAAAKPPLPDVAKLCVRCHAASAARPKSFPQIDPADHMSGIACNNCHQAHSPGMDAAPPAGGAK